MNDYREIEFDNYDQWYASFVDGVQFTVEDGTGNTYGEEGDVTAHIGPDMQADVVGVWMPEDEFGWINAEYVK